MNNLKQMHFVPLKTQGNVYTVVPISLINNTKKLLVATLKRQVFTFEYIENSSEVLMPTTKEIPFTYIPSGAEIISIDAFNKSKCRNEFVIGITIIKQSLDSGSLETYLNIYSDEEFNINSIAQNCLSVQLNFVPYHLTHTYLITWGSDEKTFEKEIVFLLSGSDNSIHIFREFNDSNSYTEIDKGNFFPEFYDVPSIVMWVDVLYFDNYEMRMTAFGCEDGYLRLTTIDTKTNSIIRNHSTEFQNMIAQVKFFSRKPRISVTGLIDNDDCDEQAEIDLLVVNTINPTVIIRDVIKDGLSQCKSLRRNDLSSVTTCCAAADIDFDGEAEIILGNSFHEILSYKQTEMSDCNGFHLADSMKLVGPIFQIFYLDLTGDGIKELIVLTIKGLYIFQHKQNAIENMLKEKVDCSIPDFK